MFGALDAAGLASPARPALLGKARQGKLLGKHLLSCCYSPSLPYSSIRQRQSLIHQPRRSIWRGGSQYGGSGDQIKSTTVDVDLVAVVFDSMVVELDFVPVHLVLTMAELVAAAMASSI
jgi:hypothetical protein